MDFTIEINNTQIEVANGETILSVLDRIGIKVPTLCSMKGFTPTGSCRMCVVEVEGRNNLIPSCSYKVEEWMKIKTHSPKVVKARKTIVELLLADHPDDCLYCERNGNCELQNLAEELHIRERKISGRKSHFALDKSSNSIVHEPNKCILCGRCVTICSEIVGVSTFERCFRGINSCIETTLKQPLSLSNCINCGQCIIHCPTAALSEQQNFSEISPFIHSSDKVLVALYSPTIPSTIAEEFNLAPNTDTHGVVNAILRKLGFDRVFDTSLGADIVVMEESNELINRINNGENIPMFTSCCPAWVKYAEQFIPELLPNLTKSKSPQQIMGAIIKTHFSKKEAIDVNSIHTVSIMPCTAKKYEASRPEMTQNGISEIDTVITTRELIRLIKLYGINVKSIEPESPYNSFIGNGSAGNLVGVTGGAAEAAIRTIAFKLTGKELDDNNINKIRGFAPFKEMNLFFNNTPFNVAVVNGMANIDILLEKIKNGNIYHFVEVMACPGGCINGGGQPICKNSNIINQRSNNIYENDKSNIIKEAHNNPKINNIYELFFNEEKSKEILHTNYSPQNK